MRSNRLAMSAAWAFTSCTQIQSGRVAAIQLSTPLLVAERMPLRLRLVNLNKEFPMVDVGAQTSEQGQLAQDFVRFAVESGVLRFGEFKTKAGRLSPYFFNAGLFDDGRKIGRLAEFYAKALLASGIEFDMVFGPAYKGIPLAATVAVELARLGRNVPFAYNRKEAKDHGEGGTLVGAPLKGRVLIVDDVMSAGTAARESIAIIRAAGATPHAVAIALDRQEKATENGQDVDHSAVQYVREQLGMQVCAIARLADLLLYLSQNGEEGMRAHHEPPDWPLAHRAGARSPGRPEPQGCRRARPCGGRAPPRTRAGGPLPRQGRPRCGARCGHPDGG